MAHIISEKEVTPVTNPWVMHTFQTYQSLPSHCSPGPLPPGFCTPCAALAREMFQGKGCRQSNRLTSEASPAARLNSSSRRCRTNFRNSPCRAKLGESGNRGPGFLAGADARKCHLREASSLVVLLPQAHKAQFFREGPLEWDTSSLIMEEGRGQTTSTGFTSFRHGPWSAAQPCQRKAR